MKLTQKEQKRDDLIETIFTAHGNSANRGMISCVLKGIEAAGLIVIDPNAIWSEEELMQIGR